MFLQLSLNCERINYNGFVLEIIIYWHKIKGYKTSDDSSQLSTEKLLDGLFL